MVVNGNDNIKIKQILMSGDKVSFVEYFSHVDSRTHIIDANRFCTVFGFSMEYLKQLKEER